jgi:hypothetical protein
MDEHELFYQKVAEQALRAHGICRAETLVRKLGQRQVLAVVLPEKLIVSDPNDLLRLLQTAQANRDIETFRIQKRGTDEAKVRIRIRISRHSCADAMMDFEVRAALSRMSYVCGQEVAYMALQATNKWRKARKLPPVIWCGIADGEHTGGDEWQYEERPKRSSIRRRRIRPTGF